MGHEEISGRREFQGETRTVNHGSLSRSKTKTLRTEGDREAGQGRKCQEARSCRLLGHGRDFI